MLPATYATPAAVLLAVGGLLACFAGYRLFRIVLGLYGFILGVMVTTSIMGTSSTNTVTLIAAALVGGILGAFLMIAAYFVGVGLIGAGLAALALNVVFHFLSKEPPTLVLVIGCVVGALGALSIVRYVVVFGTALGGAWTALIGALALMGNSAARHVLSGGSGWILYPLDPNPAYWWTVPAWLVLSAVGAVVQLGTSRAGAQVRPARRAAPKK